MKTTALRFFISVALSAMNLHGESPGAVAKSYGFSAAEFRQIQDGAILSKALPEKSDKALAGVVAIVLPKPMAELADLLLEGEFLRADPTIRALQVWKPDDSAANAFTALKTDAAMQAKLKARYEAYRQSGLQGVGQPGEELALAIETTLPTERWPGYAKALLNYPAAQLAGMEQRFFAYQQAVENRPTFILSHRARLRSDHAALITEQRYYVSQTYNCRFIASECVEVPGGTLLFYVNCLFTEQVAGWGGGLRHNIGRNRMLASVTADLKNIREQLRK